MGYRAFLFEECSIDMIMQHATNLLGHRLAGTDTIISSNRGQVVYPAFFESSNFMAKGYLQLSVFPGFLNMNGMRFDRMIDEWYSTHDRFSGEVTRSDAEEHQLRVPATFVPPRPTDSLSAPMRWRTSVYDDVLQGTLVLDDGQNGTFGGWDLVKTMSRVLLTSPCEHKPDIPAGDLAEYFYLDMKIAHRVRPQLLSAGRDYGRQLYKLAAWETKERTKNYERVIIHVDGCIRCALQLCLDSKAQVVIS